MKDAKSLPSNTSKENFLYQRCTDEQAAAEALRIMKMLAPKDAEVREAHFFSSGPTLEVKRAWGIGCGLYVNLRVRSGGADFDTFNAMPVRVAVENVTLTLREAFCHLTGCVNRYLQVIHELKTEREAAITKACSLTRQATLEECARIADHAKTQYGDDYGIAKAIRSLPSQSEAQA